MSGMSSIRKNLNGAHGGLTNEKKRLNAFAQIDELSFKLNKVAEFMMKAKQDQDNAARAISAIMALVGQDAVNAEMVRQETERLEAQVAQNEKMVAASLEAGTLGTVDTITDDGQLVVTVEKSPDGSVRHPSKVFATFRDYMPEAKELLRGKKVGDVITLPPEGVTLEVVAIYVEATPPPAPEAETPTTAEAPAEVLQ